MEKFPVDLLLRGARVFNVFRRDFRAWDVAVQDGRFFYCGVEDSAALEPAAVLDATGLWLVPGLVDIHMHIESSMVTPQAFAWALARDGVTTVVSEPHEMANVAGLAGIRAMMAQSAEGPGGGTADIFYAIPSSVPATSLETTGGVIDEAEVRELLREPSVLCLGEVMNFHEAVGPENSRTRRIIRAVREHDASMPVEGHCPRLMGLSLARMLYAGVDSDHTDQTPERMLARVEQGMFVELQYKSLLPDVVACLVEHGLHEHACLVTDDTMPDTLLAEGQLSRVYRRAVALGLPPETALYMSTYTPARRMRLTDRGAIAPGRLADFVLLDDLEAFGVHSVYKGGRLVYDRANPAPEPAITPFPDSFYHSVRLAPLSEKDFTPAVDAPDGEHAFRLMVRSPKLTAVEEGRITLSVKGGEPQWQGGTALLAVFERYGKSSGNRAFGFCGGTGITAGAVAATSAHDHHNLLVMGHNPADMALAANMLIASQGGYAVAHQGKVLAHAPLPIGGILSGKPLSQAAADLATVRKAMEDLGETHLNPLMAFSTLSLAVSPALKLTDQGLVDVRRGCVVGLLADAESAG